MLGPFRFADFVLDPRRFELRQGDRIRKLEKIPMELLILLIEREGELATRDEIVERLWGKDVFLEADQGINTAISKIRSVLRDDADHPRYVQTVVGKGYRFIAPLSQSQSPNPGPESESPPSNAAAKSPWPRRTLAVLPFSDMSPDGDQQYFCEGLAEELINALTQIEGLRVAARTASFQFRSTGADLSVIGRKLRVETLLEGSVRKSGDRLRVTVQLVEVESGFHSWSRRFDSELADVFSIQDEIASSVAACLRGTVLSQHEKRALQRPQTEGAAYEYYLRGRQFLPSMMQTDLEKSAELFGRAIEQDDNYSPAWAGMAMVHATLYEWFGAKEDNLRRAEHASRKAQDLAPELAEACVARGFTLSLGGHYDDAARQFEEAIRRNPNLFDAHYYFARSSFASGDVERSAELFRKAGDVRPEDYQSPVLLAQSLRMLGKLEESRSATREGIDRAERSLMLNPSDARALALGSVALFSDGQTARAMEWSERSLALYPDDMSTLINAACLRARAHRKEEALALLERVFAHGWGKRDWIEHDPDYDTLRDDPRFKSLLARLK
jgi:adenylate cyclase